MSAFRDFCRPLFIANHLSDLETLARRHLRGAGCKLPSRGKALRAGTKHGLRGDVRRWADLLELVIFLLGYGQEDGGVITAAIRLGELCQKMELDPLAQRGDRFTPKPKNPDRDEEMLR